MIAGNKLFATVFAKLGSVTRVLMSRKEFLDDSLVKNVSSNNCHYDKPFASSNPANFSSNCKCTKN